MKTKGSDLTTTTINLGVSMKSISTSASKCISMPLDQWAMAMELAKRYNQSSLSKAVSIAVKKAYTE